MWMKEITAEQTKPGDWKNHRMRLEQHKQQGKGEKEQRTKEDRKKGENSGRDLRLDRV